MAKFSRAVIGALIGAVVFVLLFGVKTLDPTYDSWIRQGYMEADILQRYASWQYFRNDEWQFSLTWINNAAGPEGVAAAWGDFVPWVALFFKLLSPVLPDVFQYCGYLALASFVLQGFFAWLLIDLFDDRWQTCVFGTLMFLFQPVFLERIFRHGSLSQQWMVLLPLYLYFVGRRREGMPWFWWIVVFGLIPGIHPYFMAMAFGLLCASALEKMIAEKCVVMPLGLIAVCVGVTFACGRVLGIIMPGASTGDGIFGKYSMNLNALFDPTSVDFFSDKGEVSWSLLLPSLERNFYQYDGFNYLGLGILAAIACLVVWAVVAAAKHGIKPSLKAAVGFMRSHIGLVIACAAFSVFAVSNVAYFGDKLIYSFSLPEKIEDIFSTFRSSGRIFWPVSYIITLGVILALSKLADKRFGGSKAVVVALALLLAVQVGDMSGVLIQKHLYFKQEIVAETPYQSEKAKALIANADEIRCLEGPIFDYGFAECLIHHNPKIQTNIVFFAKGNFVDTYSYYPVDEAMLLSGAEVAERVLYVTADSELCRQILESGHSELAAWQIGDFYLVGVESAGYPSPDFK